MVLRRRARRGERGRGQLQRKSKVKTKIKDNRKNEQSKDIKDDKNFWLFFTPWCQNSALSPYSVKWQGYFFSLLMATKLAPQGNVVPNKNLLKFRFRFNEQMATVGQPQERISWSGTTVPEANAYHVYQENKVEFVALGKNRSMQLICYCKS